MDSFDLDHRKLLPLQILKSSEGSIGYRHLRSKQGPVKRRILFLHGFPGSSLQISVFHPHLESHHLEVLAFDRPGYGQTRLGLQSPDQFVATRRCVEFLVEELQWVDFEIFSVSGGTPFLSSLARHFGPRVKALTVVSGLGPLNTDQKEVPLLPPLSRLALKLAPALPGRFVAKTLTKLSKSSLSRRPWIFQLFLKTSAADEKLMSLPNANRVLREGLLEAFQQDSLGPQRDARAFLSPWRPHLGTCKANPVLWHGLEDLVLSPEMAKRAANQMPGSRLHLIPNEGHYSLIVNKMSEILSDPAQGTNHPAQDAHRTQSEH